MGLKHFLSGVPYAFLFLAFFFASSCKGDHNNAVLPTERPAPSVDRHPSSRSNPAPWHPPAHAGGGKRFLATGKNRQSRVSSSGRSRCLSVPTSRDAGGGSTTRTYGCFCWMLRSGLEGTGRTFTSLSSFFLNRSLPFNAPCLLPEGIVFSVQSNTMPAGQRGINGIHREAV